MYGDAPTITPEPPGSFKPVIYFMTLGALAARPAGGRMGSVTPLLIHVPHASDLISEGERADFSVSEGELGAARRLLTDWFTDELYADGADPEDVVAAPASRLVVDVERFEEDAREPCAKSGMGAVYVSTPWGAPLRRVSDERREQLLAAHYRPHHQRLDEAARIRLARFGRCVVLDAHSFPTLALPTQSDFSPPPEIGIGAEPGHTPPALLAHAVGFFEARGFKVGVNTPFSGAMVPSAFLGRDARVTSVMVEVRRDLYMDEAACARNSGFGRIREVLTEFRSTLSAVR